MQRFFLKTPAFEALRIHAVDQTELYHQITRVLRMQIGENCIFFEEGGDNLIYEITSIDKKSVELKRISTSPGLKPDPLKIVLVQALPNKLEKLEFILQKGVETGTDEFIFFPADRSQKLALLDKKIDRFQQIIVEAVEQSGRNRIPRISIFQDRLDENLAILPQSTGEAQILVAHTDGRGESLRDININKGAIYLFVGPEGGFSPREIEVFRSNGAKFLDLGDRVLRTETAGMVMAFVLKLR